MRWRTFGLLLLLLSLSTGVLGASHVKTYASVQQFVRNAQDGTEVKDMVVNVPPWNATERKPAQGWVGFNVTLTPDGKMDYTASGLIIPNDEDKTPDLVMRAVNITGLQYLKDDQFDPYDWDIVEVYAAALLNSTRLYDRFSFVGVDNSSVYTVLFRGLKNETQDRPILVNLKEAWLEERNLLDPSGSNALIIVAATAAIVGLALAIKNPRSQKRVRRLKTHGRHARFLCLASYKNVTRSILSQGETNKSFQPDVERSMSLGLGFSYTSAYKAEPH
jgi:hypothetical protein